jgi:hypothetical protein
MSLSLSPYLPVSLSLYAGIYMLVDWPWSVGVYLPGRQSLVLGSLCLPVILFVSVSLYLPVTLTLSVSLQLPLSLCLIVILTLTVSLEAACHSVFGCQSIPVSHFVSVYQLISASPSVLVC